VNDPKKVGASWDEALSADRPVVISFRTDPEVPPLPPHITFDQAKKFMTSLLHDPSRAAMLKQSMKEMFDSFKK
jgi:pyruvate dehydrogenase (quinone)